jgi:hypothetical protein
MGYRESVELSTVRFALRERLEAGRSDDVGRLLARFGELSIAAARPELMSEWERWQLRFELLEMAAARNASRVAA